MKRNPTGRRRGAGPITLGRASRLHHLIAILERAPEAREDLLRLLGIGLRTFYRELELLQRCGIKLRREGKLYHLKSSTSEAEGRLPFPDPQLSFAEMTELSRHEGPAAARLAALLHSVITHPELDAPARAKPAPKGKARKGKSS